MRIIRLFPLVFLIAACGLQPPTPLPTLTPTLTLVPTATIEWFPATETPTVVPTMPRTPTPDLHPGLGSIVLEDDFSTDEDWFFPSVENTSAAIANQHLTLVVSRPGYILFTNRKEPLLKDFYAEITVSPNLCSGEDEYGIMVRTSSNLAHFRFVISCDGRAKVVRASRNDARVVVPWENIGLIPSLAPGDSRLAVWAYGEEMRFFINDQYIFSVRDTVLLRGTFGVFVRTTGDETISVNFSDLVVRGISP